MPIASQAVGELDDNYVLVRGPDAQLSIPTPLTLRGRNTRGGRMFIDPPLITLLQFSTLTSNGSCD